jgi:hypothetical protein
VRAYARSSVTITRVYGYSQTLDVNLSPGESKRFSCGLVKGPPLRKPLILTSALITILLRLGSWSRWKHSGADTICIRHVSGLDHTRMQLVWTLIYTREIHLP